jgi:hypothetical protein
MMLECLNTLQVAKNFFSGTRSAKSVKARATNILNRYKAIVRFEQWTGNGAGDPDKPDPLDVRLDRAQRSGRVEDIGDLNPNIIETFKSPTEGFYDLLDAR